MEDIKLGVTTIAPSVIVTISRLNTLAVPGVSRMAPTVISRWNSTARHDNEGVKVKIVDSKIYLDLYVVIKSSENVRLVAESIQERVNRAISEIVGMEVAQINVHVTDVDIDVETSTL